MRRPHDRGAVTVEFVLLLPLLLLVLGVVVAGARIWWARTTVTQLASSAARQASISRDVGSARTSAQALVASDAAQTGLRCATGTPVLVLDTSAFGQPVGTPGRVRAQVTCSVALSDVLVPGLPGSVLVEGDATSTLDRFRARRP